MLNTSSAFEQFAQSSIWKDILEELDVWVKQIHEAMENPEIDEKIWRQLQGNAESLRKVRLIPLVLAENLKQMEEEKND